MNNKKYRDCSWLKDYAEPPKPRRNWRRIALIITVIAASLAAIAFEYSVYTL